MTRVVITFLSLCCLTSVWASQTDSLIAALEKTDNDTDVVNIYYQIIRSAEYSEPKVALEYSRLILEHPLNQEDHYKARNLINHGKLYKNISQYDSAVSYMLEGIRLAEKNEELKTQAMGYNSLGVIFKMNSEWDEALKYYKLSNAVCVKLNYANGAAMTFNNIGTIYDAQGNLDSALVYYQRAAQIAEEGNLVNAMAIAYNNLGEYYAKSGKEDKAIPYFLKTLKSDEQTGNIMGMCYTLLNLANSYKVLKQFDSAFYYFDLAETNINQVQNPQLMISLDHGLSDTYEKTGKTELALYHFKKSKQLNDSVFNAEKSKQMLEMKTKYETEQKELEITNLSQENEIKELEIERSNARLVWTGTASFAVLIIGLLGFLQFRNRQKRKFAETLVTEQQKGINAVILAEENERKRIAKDLHDGIGQQLSGLKLFFDKLKGELLVKEPAMTGDLKKFEEVLDGACTDVRSISHQMMPRVLIEKGLVEALEDMLSKSLGLSDIRYTFEHFNLQDRYKERIEISIYRICQELVNNIIKHSNAQQVTVQLYQNKSHLIIHVEDDGVGFDKSKSKDGIGQLNLSSRINNLNGSLAYESEPGKGTSATIRIPV